MVHIKWYLYVYCNHVHDQNESSAFMYFLKVQILNKTRNSLKKVPSRNILVTLLFTYSLEHAFKPKIKICIPLTNISRQGKLVY